MSRFAEAIAEMEGFGKPDAIPTVRHNPGDLRHSPHSSHEGVAPDAIGIIDSDADGWTDLELQLMRYARRGFTVRQAIYEFAPPSENNTEHYLQFVCSKVGCTPEEYLLNALSR